MALKEKLIDKAQKFIQKGYLDKAVVEYRAAADADPRDISIRLRIGDLYVKLGKKNEAVKEYTEAAKANAQRGFYLKAIAVYKQVLKLEENLETHNKLAELYLKQRLIADAVGEYSYIVHWYETRGKSKEVLELLKKMVDIDPENIGVRLKLADLYQKLSFDKDSLAEYSVIFEKLLQAGKFDKAEKVYLSLYNANPSEERVMSGLAELYRLKGDDAQRLKFLKGLLNYYSGASMTEEATKAAQDIVGINPEDPHASRFLKKGEKNGRPEAVAVKAPSEPEAFSIASSIEVPVDGGEQEKAAEEEPIVSWPEQEIEITIEGFEEGAAKSMAEVESMPDALSEEPVKAPEEPAETSASKDDGGASVESAASAPEARALAGDEIEIDIDDLLNGELPQADAFAVAGESAASSTTAEVEDAFVPETPAEEQAVEVLEVTSSEPGQVQVEQPAEDAGIEDAISEISAELEEGLDAEPLSENANEPAAQLPDAVHVEEVTEDLESEAVGQAVEVDEANEAVTEQTIPEPEPAEIGSEPEIELLEPDSSSREAVEAYVEVSEERAVLDEGEVVEIIDIKAEPLLEEIAADASVEVSREHPDTLSPVEVPGAEPVSDIIEEAVPEAEAEEEELQEDLSSAIQELMEKMEPEEAQSPLEAPAAEGASPHPQEDYVDLSAELGMEEALKDFANPWDGKESAETFDEFKDGIGNQLSKEDSETHYNLGIAYMEMELHSEASKEFKIALKDARLELDCYTRLGLCAMAENNPEEAAAYYSRGLKATDRSEDEKKALMYELALAYEASGRGDEALELFREIFAMDPEFREAASKVNSFMSTRPMVPLDDGLIEVELL